MFDVSTAPLNDEVLTVDADPAPPPVPAAAPDLFRQIAKIVGAKRSRLEMRAWHLTASGEDIDVGEVDVRDLEAVVCDCGTSHCLAGWIVALTPGGLELERWMSQDWSFFAANVTTDWWSATARTLDLRSYWIEDYRHYGSAVPTPLTALAILEKGGWHRSAKGSRAFQPHYFLQVDRAAREYIDLLALEESHSSRVEINASCAAAVAGARRS